MSNRSTLSRLAVAGTSMKKRWCVFRPGLPVAFRALTKSPSSVFDCEPVTISNWSLVVPVAGVPPARMGCGHKTRAKAKAHKAREEVSARWEERVLESSMARIPGV